MVLKLQGYRARNEEIKVVAPTREKSAPNAAPVQVAVSQPTNSPPKRPTNSSNSASGPPPALQTLEHEVQPGDTLYAISRKHNVSVEQIRTWNNIDASNLLKVGQKLIIRK